MFSNVENYCVRTYKTQKKTEIEKEERKKKQFQTHILDNSMASSSCSFAANALKLLL